MARFDHATFGTDVFASSSTDASGIAADLSDAYIDLTPLDDRTIKVVWRAPAADHVARILMRSEAGYPVDPSTAQGVVLLSVNTDADPPDPNVNVRQLAAPDRVSPGSEAFYTLFAAIPDADSPDSSTWQIAAQASVRLVTRHDSFHRLRTMLPWAFTAEGSTEIEGVEEPKEPLSRVLAVMGGVYDRVLTDADRLLSTRDARLTPTSLLNAYSDTLGVPVEPGLGPVRQRALAANSQRIFALKATLEGIRLFAECVTGADVIVQPGKNMFPSVAVSAYDRQLAYATYHGSALTSSQTRLVLPFAQGLPWPTRGSLLEYPVWARYVPTSGSQEVVRITGVTGNVITIERGQYGTAALGRNSGSILWDATWSGWAVPPGYDAKYDTVGSASFTPAIPSVQPTQLPTGHGFLSITQIVSSPGIPAELSYGPKRFVARFTRSHGVCTVSTYQPHSLVVGQRFQGVLGGDLETHSVTNVLDQFRFVFTTTDFTDYEMPSTAFAANPVPYIEGSPHPATMLSVLPGLPYTFSTRVRADTTARLVRPAIGWYDSYGKYFGRDEGNFTSDSTTGWTTLTVSAIAPPRATLACVVVEWYPASPWAIGETHMITQHQFEQSATATAYDEGGLIRVGLAADAQIDPLAVIRTRTTTMLSDYSTDARRYRVEFLNRSIYLPTGSSWALLNTIPQHWGDLDFYTRVRPQALSDWQTVASARDSSGTAQWELDIGATTFRLRANESITATSATYGVGEYGVDAYTVESSGAGTAFGAGDYGVGNYGGSGVFVTIAGGVHGLTNGHIGWVRVTRDASTGVVKFYSANDSQTQPKTWTLVTTYTGITGDFPVPTTTIVLGSQSTGGFVGDIYAAEITRNYIDKVKLNAWLHNPFTRTIHNSGSLGGEWYLSSGLYPSNTLFPSPTLHTSGSVISVRSEFP